MNARQAKSELNKIRSQKTVSVSRLNRILDILDYEDLERCYIQQARKIKRLKDDLNKHQATIERQRRELKRHEASISVSQSN